MSENYEAVDDVGDVSTLKGDKNMIATVRAWFQAKFTLIESRLKAQQEKHWHDFLAESLQNARTMGLLPQPNEPEPA